MKMKLLSIFTIGIVSMSLACSMGSKPSETANSTNSAANTTKSNATDTTKSNTNETTKTDTETSSPSADLAGTYTVNGTGVDGKSYQGKVVVTNRDDVYQLSWEIGKETYDGIAVQSGNTLAAAYTTGTDGKGCGAVVYKINSDNSLDGKWGEWGVNQSGTEKATPAGELNGSVGSFDVSGTNPSKAPYKGKLIISKSGNDVYQFAWDAGMKYVGTGVKMGDYLAAGSGTKQCGFVIYEVKGNTLEGKWGVPGSTALGTEKAVKD